MPSFYRSEVLLSIKFCKFFFLEPNRRLWVPITGGANVPALNTLLTPFGVQFGCVSPLNSTILNLLLKISIFHPFLETGYLVENLSLVI